jgi:hypothetical protein
MTTPTASPGTPWSAAAPRQLVFAPRGRREVLASFDGSPCLLVRLPSPWRVHLLPVLLVLSVTGWFVLALIRSAIGGMTGTAYWVCLGFAVVASFWALQFGQFLAGTVPIVFRAADAEGRPLLTLRRRVGWNPITFRRTVHDAEDNILGAVILRWSSWRVHGRDGGLRFAARDPELLAVHLRPRHAPRMRLAPLTLNAADGATAGTVVWSRSDRSFTLDAGPVPPDAFALVLAWAVLADQTLHR